ncbi:MAG: HEAT repeat domain-containing protein [Planctomycetota bacterium]
MLGLAARFHLRARGRSAFLVQVSSCTLLGFSALIAGCGPRPYRADIQSESVHERILGVRAAAEAKDADSVPLLVDRLEDEDDAVRFFSILALEKITGQRFGYDYASPAQQRAGSVERWRAYVRQGEHGDTAPPGEASGGSDRHVGGQPSVSR